MILLRRRPLLADRAVRLLNEIAIWFGRIMKEGTTRFFWMVLASKSPIWPGRGEAVSKTTPSDAFGNASSTGMARTMAISSSSR